MYNKLENYIADLLGQFPNDSLIYREKVIYDPKTKTKKGVGEAGTIDLLVLEPSTNGFKANILDWKFMGDRLQDIAPYKQHSFDIQIGTYNRILKE